MRVPAHRIHLRVGPYADTDISVSFEPSGIAYELAPGDWFSVALTGDGSGLVEIGHAPGVLIIGAWEEAHTEVRTQEGRLLQV